MPEATPATQVREPRGLTSSGAELAEAGSLYADAVLAAVRQTSPNTLTPFSAKAAACTPSGLEAEQSLRIARELLRLMSCQSATAETEARLHQIQAAARYTTLAGRGSSSPLNLETQMHPDGSRCLVRQSALSKKCICVSLPMWRLSHAPEGP